LYRAGLLLIIRRYNPVYTAIGTSMCQDPTNQLTNSLNGSESFLRN